MKSLSKIFKTVALFLALLLDCSAQENQGALAFVNAVALEKPTEILVNGTSIKPGGFESGQVTSFIAVPSSVIEVRAKNGDIQAKSLSATPSPTASMILVVFLSETSGTQADMKRELRAISIPSASASSGFRQRILLVGQEKPAVFLANGEQITLTPGIPSVGVESGDVKIEIEGGQLVGSSSSPEPGNFLIVVFPDLKGGYKSTSIRDNMITFKIVD